MPKSLRDMVKDALELSKVDLDNFISILLRVNNSDEVPSEPSTPSDFLEIPSKTKKPTIRLPRNKAARKAVKETISKTHYWCPAYTKTFPSGKIVRVKGHWTRRWRA